MHLAYFITAHGYGHAVRSTAICNAFSPDVQLTLRSAIPDAFFREELHRPYRLEPGEFDCGCLQQDGVSVDEERTLARYVEIADRNERRLDEEVRWCRERRIDGIVADAPPFALEIAARAGIPAVAATNFTWYDIYREYAQGRDWFAPHLERIRRQYAGADALHALAPALPMAYFGHRIEFPPVGRSGVNRADELRRRFGLQSSMRTALIYLGNFGLDGVCWSLLERCAGWEFFGVYPLAGQPRNYHVLEKSQFRYPDLAASVDLVIGKMGYGTLAECMIHGTPFAFLPRARFAEYPVLEAAALEWGGGYRVTVADLAAGRLKGILDRVAARPHPPEPMARGAEDCARAIERRVGR